MYIKNLSFGNPIEIEIIAGDADKEIIVNTKVDSINKNVLKAVVPNYLRALDIVRIYLYFKSDGKCSRWECNFLGFEKSNLLTLIVLSSDHKSKNINNRTAFRVPYGEDIDYCYFETMLKGHLKDISATGMGLLSNQEHEIGATINLTIEDLGYKLKLQGHVVRRTEQIRSIFKYLYGIKLDEEKEEVTSYVFKKQVEIIRERKRLM